MTSPDLRAFLALGALSFAWAAPCQAVTCYVVFDRNDNVVYRDITPPVDMSAGSPARDAMRRRGEYLMFFDSERCPPVEFLTGAAGDARLDFSRSTPVGPSAATPPPDSAKPIVRPAGKPQS